MIDDRSAHIITVTPDPSHRVVITVIHYRESTRKKYTSIQKTIY